jgi:hypothetical protein
LLNIKNEDNDFNNWSSFKTRNLKIFIVDLKGELYSDYQKGLKRYNNKWIDEANKIIHIMKEFNLFFIDKKL